MKLLLIITLAVLATGAVAAEKPKVTKGKLMSVQGIGEATEKKLNTAGITKIRSR